MSSFTDDLDVRYLAGPGRDRWVTLREFHYWTDESDGQHPLQCGTCFVVPEGTETDFASIPAPFWPVIGHPAGPYVQASVLHDWLYRSGCVSRARADAIFREAMEVLGVPAWKRWAMWAAVRVGGASAYADAAPAAAG